MFAGFDDYHPFKEGKNELGVVIFISRFSVSFSSESEVVISHEQTVGGNIERNDGH